MSTRRAPIRRNRPRSSRRRAGRRPPVPAVLVRERRTAPPATVKAAGASPKAEPEPTVDVSAEPVSPPDRGADAPAGTSSPDGPATADDPPRADRTAPTEPVASEAAAPASVGESGESGETHVASQPVQQEQASQGDQARADRGPQQGGGQNGQRQPGGGQQNRGPGTQNQGNQNQGNQNQGNQNQGNQNQGNQQGLRLDDSEPGNRRRRRRGRDRERGPSTESEETFLGEPIDVEGLLDLRDEGFGFLRLKGFFPSKEDVYVSVKQVRQFALRKGDRLKGKSRAASRNEKNPALLADRCGQRGRSGEDAPTPTLRGPHAVVPRREVASRGRRRPRQHDRANRRPHRSDRQGSAWPDRVAAEGRQDVGDEADRAIARGEQPRDRAHRAPGRRAARGGHRHAPVAAPRRGRRFDVRPPIRGAHGARRTRDRAGQADGRRGQGRRHHPGRHHPSRPRLQPGRTGQWPDHVWWHRCGSAVPAEEVFRSSPQCGRRGLA